MGMSLAQYATVSNYSFASAAAVLSLACLTYLAQWAFARAPQAATALVPSTGTATGTAQPDQRADTAEGSQASKYDMAGSIGTSLTGLSWLIVLVAVVTRGLAAERTPWGNMFEFAGVGTLIVLTAYLVLNRLWGVEWLGPIITGFCVIMLGLSMLVYVPAGPLVPALHSYWLVIHVFAALVAGAAFLVGAAASILYLVKARAENKLAAQAGQTAAGRTAEGQGAEVPGGSTLDTTRIGIVARMPAAAKIDTMAYRIHAFAFPIWTFAALIAGPIWAQYSWGRYWGWDPKEVWAFITWVIYAGYLHARVTAGWKGKAAAIIAIIGFVSFLFNFVGVNLLIPGLHSYAT